MYPTLPLVTRYPGHDWSNTFDLILSRNRELSHIVSSTSSSHWHFPAYQSASQYRLRQQSPIGLTPANKPSYITSIIDSWSCRNWMGSLKTTQLTTIFENQSIWFSLIQLIQRHRLMLIHAALTAQLIHTSTKPTDTIYTHWYTKRMAISSQLSLTCGTSTRLNI